MRPLGAVFSPGPTRKPFIATKSIATIGYQLGGATAGVASSGVDRPVVRCRLCRQTVTHKIDVAPQAIKHVAKGGGHHDSVDAGINVIELAQQLGTTLRCFRIEDRAFKVQQDFVPAVNTRLDAPAVKNRRNFHRGDHQQGARHRG